MHFKRSGLHRFLIANNRCLWYTETEKEGKTVKIAICDDNNDFLCQLGTMLENWPQAPENITTAFFTDGDALLASHRNHPFDIILLDVVMPLLNGIQAAHEIREEDSTVKIVFLTSSPEFAVDSYSVRASNYLLKPLDQERFYRCMNELAADLQEKARSIPVKGLNSVRRVELESIEYLEAQNKRVLVVLKDGSSIVSTEPLYHFEEMLLSEDGFYKCSRSYIVNIQWINTYTLKEIRMRSGCRIPISRACQREFEAVYFSTIFRKAGDAD